MPDNTKKYNYCLDFIKGIACILVVFMHCEFPGILGTAVQAVSRFCVPLFFMVSGYFCYFVSTESPDISSKMIKKIKHVGKITLFACLAYIAFDIVQYFIFDRSVFTFSKGSLLNLIIFNQPFIVAGQYWFLFALLYDYILFALILKFRIIKYVYIIAFGMIAVYIALAQGAHLLGIHIPNCYYRNFLIEGLCFFVMGNWIHLQQCKLKFTPGGGGGSVDNSCRMFGTVFARKVCDGARLWSEHHDVSSGILLISLCGEQSRQTCGDYSNDREKIFYVCLYNPPHCMAFDGVCL